jgi:hypothetical protein
METWWARKEERHEILTSLTLKVFLSCGLWRLIFRQTFLTIFSEEFYNHFLLGESSSPNMEIVGSSLTFVNFLQNYRLMKLVSLTFKDKKSFSLYWCWNPLRNNHSEDLRSRVVAQWKSFRIRLLSILKKSQRDDTLYSILLFPVSRSTCFGLNPRPSSGARLNCIHSIWSWTVSSDSSTTTARHTLFNTRCCEYSLIELLMMGVGYARNI